jgi:hypothetical protein
LTRALRELEMQRLLMGKGAKKALVPKKKTTTQAKEVDWTGAVVGGETGGLPEADEGIATGARVWVSFLSFFLLNGAGVGADALVVVAEMESGEEEVMKRAGGVVLSQEALSAVERRESTLGVYDSCYRLLRNAFMGSIELALRGSQGGVNSRFRFFVPLLSTWSTAMSLHVVMSSFKPLTNGNSPRSTPCPTPPSRTIQPKPLQHENETKRHDPSTPQPHLGRAGPRRAQG